MNTLQLKEGIFWAGILDAELEVFDIVMETEFGTTYNSYVVKGSEKTAVIETAKATFMDAYLEKLQEITKLEDIDYLILNHTEPDHAGSAAKLLEKNPDIEVFGTTGAMNYLREILNFPFKAHPVKENETLELGGKTLQFILAPQLHWPDTMYTYVQEDQVLFTCDSFGAHYCHDGVLRSTVTAEADYLSALEYYFRNILAPFKPFMLKAMAKIENLPISMICPGHGPVLDSHLAEIRETYRTWCTKSNPNEGKTVVIAYVSSYGYTKEMAEAIAAGVTEGGAAAHLYDLLEHTPASLEDELYWADGILLGSPTILADALRPVYELTLHLYPTIHGGKKAGAFGSYGWSGEAVPNLTTRLQQLKMKTVEGLRIKFRPGEADKEQCAAFGRAFAESLHQ